MSLVARGEVVRRFAGILPYLADPFWVTVCFEVTEWLNAVPVDRILFIRICMRRFCKQGIRRGSETVGSLFFPCFLSMQNVWERVQIRGFFPAATCARSM